MNTLTGRITRIALPAILVTSLVALGALFVYAPWPTKLQTGEWATWAQAFFSVMAILAAIAVAASQRRQDREREEARDCKRAFDQMAVVLGLVDHVVALMAELPGNHTNPLDIRRGVLGFKHSDFARALDALDKFGPEHVPDGAVLKHIIELAGILADTSLQVSATLPTPLGVEASVWPATAKALDDLTVKARTARTRLFDVQQRYK